MGSIKITEAGGAEIYEEERFLRRLNRYEWELFKPYVKTVDYYEFFLRTDYVNNYIVENSKYIDSIYYYIIMNWNESAWWDKDSLIEEMSKAGLKDEFSFSLSPYSWAKQYLCTVFYCNEKKKLVYFFEVKDIHLEGENKND